MGKERELMLSGDQRVVYGYLVTIVDSNGPGSERVLHLFGSVREAMSDLVREIERREGDWRVRSISSPPSVYRDMQGTRQQRRRRSFDPYEGERWLLSLVDRIDLLEEHPVHSYLDERKRPQRQRGGRKENE